MPDDPELEDPVPLEPVPEFPPEFTKLEFPVSVDPELPLTMFPLDPFEPLPEVNACTFSEAQRPSSQVKPVGQDEHCVPRLYIGSEAIFPPTA